MIARSPLKRRPPKRLPGFDNPAYREWLKKWPCFVCLKRYYERNVDYLSFSEVVSCPTTRALVQSIPAIYQCGITEAAHVGVRGLGQRCADREAMPLGTFHHEHATAGGGRESHHTLGVKFWETHGIERGQVLSLLQKLYEAETGFQA